MLPSLISPTKTACLPSAGDWLIGAAIFRAHEVLTLCLEHAEQLPLATRHLFRQCQLQAVLLRHLERPRPQVVPLSEGHEDRLQQAHRQTAEALLLVSSASLLASSI